ncbi:MAG: sulfite exporter TauE/SafE family protein, partial [Candidatus Omnitrophica bacterium]|nr:sulfite exporter TauE/SafE family protein [Candidatus Omnitrophota bacterium]
GIAGPCIFFCAPIIATYVAASQKSLPQGLARIALFLTGRIVAYAVLGYLAGLSGELLRSVINSRYTPYFRYAGGLISILLGLIVLLGKEKTGVDCNKNAGTARSSAGFLIFGFLIGCAPCAPLIALVSEIVLISKNAFQGASYAAVFGAGTFLSGLIAAASMAGIIGLIPSRFLKSDKARTVFKVICALLLILLGLAFLW